MRPSSRDASSSTSAPTDQDQSSSTPINQGQSTSTPTGQEQSTSSATDQEQLNMLRTRVELLDIVLEGVRDSLSNKLLRSESLQGKLRRSSRPPLPQDWNSMKLRGTTQKTERTALHTHPSSSTGFNTFPRILKPFPRRHSEITRLTEAQIKERYGGDDNKVKMHCCMNNFSGIIENLSITWNALAYILPKYLAERGRKEGVDFLAPHKGAESVVIRLSKQLQGIIPMIEPFCDDLRGVFAEWDSNSPNLSDAIMKKIDHLKCITIFLNVQDSLIEDFTDKTESDDRFKTAVKQFATTHLKDRKEVLAGISSVYSLLISVRTKMEEYLGYLEPGTMEKEKAEQAYEKLKENINLANASIERVCLEDLKAMQKHFEGYNVFSNDNRIVYQSNGSVKVGEKRLFRYIIMLNDSIWLLSSKKGNVHMEYTGTKTDAFVLRKDIKSAQGIFFKDLVLDNCDVGENYLRIATKEKTITIHFEQQECYENYFKYMREAHKKIGEYQNRIPESCAKHDSSIRELRRASTIAINYNRDSTNEESSSGTVSDFGFKDVVWTAEFRSDFASDYCMMKNCNTEFGKKEKKRICTSCGWIICKKCCGEAPVEAYDLETKLVCPDCFSKIKMRYDNGLLFPENHPSSSTSRLQLNSKEMDNNKLFKTPVNFNLVKTEVDEHMKTSKVSGEAKLKNSQKKPITLLGKNVGFVVFRPADKWLQFHEKKDSKIIGGWNLKSERFKEVQGRHGVSFEFPEEKLAFILKVPKSDAKKWRAVINWNFSKIN
ncbi:unnamed protein product [Caenorhabditis brenneri]